MNYTSLLTGAALAVCTIVPALAGTPAAKAPLAPAPAAPAMTGSLTLGYDTQYLYRGYEVLSSSGEKAENLLWGALDLNFGLTDKLSLNLNAWYAQSGSANYSEVDLYTRLSYNFGAFTAGPSFKYYGYPKYGDAVDTQLEPGIEATITAIPNTTIYLGAFYELEAEQFYYELGVSYTAKICDSFSLVPGVSISYIDVDSADFALNESDFHHVTVSLKAPIALTKTITLTPYIAGNFPIGDQVDSFQDNLVYGGANVSFSF